MLPARVLLPLDAFEIDLHDMNHDPRDGNKFILVLVDRDSKFILACPEPSKASEPVASKLLTLCLTLGVACKIRSNAGGS